jgi:hypothetical protein
LLLPCHFPLTDSNHKRKLVMHKLEPKILRVTRDHPPNYYFKSNKMGTKRWLSNTP